MAHEMFLAEDYYNKAKNIYEAIMVIAKRARDIGESQRKEMDAYLSQVEMLEKFHDEDEGMIEDSPVAHEPILQFEKPTVLSLREMIADKIEVSRPEEETSQVVEIEPVEIPDLPKSFPSKLNLFEETDNDNAGE